MTVLAQRPAHVPLSPGAAQGLPDRVEDD